MPYDPILQTYLKPVIFLYGIRMFHPMLRNLKTDFLVQNSYSSKTKYRFKDEKSFTCLFPIASANYSVCSKIECLMTRTTNKTYYIQNIQRRKIGKRDPTALYHPATMKFTLIYHSGVAQILFMKAQIPPKKLEDELGK